MTVSTMPGTEAVRSAWRSPALRAALALALSGVAFAVANLLLARVLPKEEYGRFALVLAIATVGILTGPLGANVIVNRQRVDPGWRLIRRTLGTSTLVALILAVAAGVLYPLDLPLLAVVIAVTIAGSCKLVAVGHYQSRQRYGLFAAALREHQSVAAYRRGSPPRSSGLRPRSVRRRSSRSVSRPLPRRAGEAWREIGRASATRTRLSPGGKPSRW